MRVILACLLIFAVAPFAANAQFQDGTIYVTDYTGVTVYEVDPVTWTWTVFADASDGLAQPSAMGFTQNGMMLIASYGNSQVLEFDWAGNGTVVLDVSDGLNGPWGENGIVVDGTGQIFVSNYSASQILRFQPDYTGSFVFADSADGIVKPDGMTFTASGDMIVANRASGGKVMLFDTAGNGSTFDQIGGEELYGAAIRDNGDIYIAGDGEVYRYIGGNPASRVILGSYGSSNSSLQFSLDHTILYHVNYGDGILRALDPDTGAATVMVNAGWGPVAVAVVGSQNPPGSVAPFGTGVAGTGGMMPLLDCSGDPRIGQNMTVEIRDFVGGARSFFFVSTGRNDWPVLGGTVYPSFFHPFALKEVMLPGTQGVAGDGDLDLPYTIPSNPALIATRWYLQHLAFDPGAVQGVAMTNGVACYLGQ